MLSSGQLVILVSVADDTNVKAATQLGRLYVYSRQQKALGSPTPAVIPEKAEGST